MAPLLLDHTTLQIMLWCPPRWMDWGFLLSTSAFSEPRMDAATCWVNNDRMEGCMGTWKCFVKYKLLCLHSFYKYPQTAIWSSNFPFYLDSRPSSFKQIANSLSFLQQLGTLHPHCIIVSKTLSFISIILLSDSLPKSNTPIGLLPLSPLLSPTLSFYPKSKYGSNRALESDN